MKIHEIEQYSPDWWALRCGKITASEMSNLVTPAKWEIAKGKAYLFSKLAERFSQTPLQTFTGGAAEQGSLLEDEAIPYFELETGKQVRRVGFITSDDGRCGCSPDGIIGDDGDFEGLESKSPQPPKHVEYLLGGVLPAEYSVQVHSSMLFTGMRRWWFTSYARNYPALRVCIERDDGKIQKLRDALAVFLKEYDEQFERLVDLNGGLPPSPPTVSVDRGGGVTRTMAGRETDVEAWVMGRN